MKETTFINQNKKKWAQFEKMAQSKSADPDEVSQLFVEITDDLAYAQTHYPKRTVRVYLNSLAQRVFHDLYKKRKEPISKFLSFWSKDLPLEMYRSRRSVLLAFVIFIVGMLIGIVSTIDDENFLGAVIGYEYVNMAEANIESGKPMNVYGQGDEIEGFVSIAFNNLRVALMTFVLGIFFALGAGVFLFFNAIMVGAFQWFYVVRGLTWASFLTIWIHGAFEIPAIILAGAAGMTLGTSIMFPGTLTRAQSLVHGAKRGVKIMIGIFPVIVLAAFIEGFATRHTVITTVGEPLVSEWPNGLKLTFIISCFSLFIWYFIIYPFVVARKHNFTGKEVEPPQYREQKNIETYKVKDVGEIFIDTFIVFRKCFGLFSKLFLITIPLNCYYLYLLFSKYPYVYIEDVSYIKSYLGNIIILRIQKMIENIELLFVWNQFFNLQLYLIQVLVFTLNTISIVFAFKVLFQKSINSSFKSYIQFAASSFFKIAPVYLILGLIACFAPFFLMVLLSALTPLLFMFDKPMIFGKKSVSKELENGFTIGFKSYGSAIGIFFALFVTLFIIYVFIGVPVEIFKDYIVEWFVLPLANDPKYWLILTDAFVYLMLAHFIFPIFYIAYTFIYFSTIEKIEGISMFEKLKKFGTESNNYELLSNENEQ